MSREIPIVVDPGYEASCRNRRRGSDSTNSASSIHQAPEEKPCNEDKNLFVDRSFQRRLSEDPNTASRKTNYYRSPSYEEGNPERLKRRGSVPVYWNLPHGGRDRFAEIVERFMNSNDEELLSGLMEENLEPFDVDEIHEESSGPEVEGTTARHEKEQCCPSAPVGGAQAAHGLDRPFNMSYKKDKGSIQIPVQVCTSKENSRNEEKQHETTEKIPEEGKEEDGEASNIVKKAYDSEIKNETVQTNGNLEVKISLDAATECCQKTGQGQAENSNDNESSSAKTEQSRENHNAHSTADDQSRTQEEQAKAETADKAKLFHIKEIENKLKQTHEEVTAFNGSNGKEYLVLEELLMKALMSLDAVEANGNTIVREARKAVVMRVQEDLKELEKKRFELDELDQK